MVNKVVMFAYQIYGSTFGSIVCQSMLEKEQEKDGLFKRKHVLNHCLSVLSHSYFIYFNFNHKMLGLWHHRSRVVDWLPTAWAPHRNSSWAYVPWPTQWRPGRTAAGCFGLSS